MTREERQETEDRADTEDVGVVVIGRNEGDRLVTCLRSAAHQVRHIVYVDSGSSDGSQPRARECGADVVVLDCDTPFTAARARNAGLSRLLELDPRLSFVQFVDGDCELRDRWIHDGVAVLRNDDTIAVVCGRLRERYPERSVYNRMCDIGWDYPVGDIAACGGLAMYRVSDFRQVDGFNSSLIAGEEFELCSRIRANSRRIVRIDVEMAWHDVGITRFSQWWRRHLRGGYGFAEGCFLYDKQLGRSHRKATVSSVFWALLLPAAMILAIIAAALVRWPGLSLAVFVVPVIYAAQFLRLTLQNRGRNRGVRDSAGYSFFLMLSKFPEAHGILRYWIQRLRRKKSEIIEYRN